MNIIARIFRSIQDGSILIKLHNRFSNIHHSPSFDSKILKYLSEHYDPNKLNRLSNETQMILLDYAPAFEMDGIKN